MSRLCRQSIVKDGYDYVIIDCPPALTSIVANAMVASDYLIIVAQANGLSYKGAQMIISLYNDIISDKRLNPSLKILGFMITTYLNDKISSLFLEQFQEDYGQLVIKPVIRKSTKLVQATSFNKSIFELDPQGKASEDYARVSQELLLRIDSDIRHKSE